MSLDGIRRIKKEYREKIEDSSAEYKRDYP